MSTGVVSALQVDKDKPSKWRFLKYGWTALKNLFYLWLVFLAFGKMSSAFETLVLSLLILIFQSVRNTLTIFIRTFIEEAHVTRSLFLGLYKKFDDPEIGEGEEALKNIVKDYHKSDPIFYINSVGNGLAFVYVLWKVIQVLVLS
jgi:hypothetical protein